jgi:hypothetical protein
MELHSTDIDEASCVHFFLINPSISAATSMIYVFVILVVRGINKVLETVTQSTQCMAFLFCR